MPSTKIEFNCNRIARVQGLDELAQLLFPGNRSQQRVFLAIFIELKYAPGQFLPHLSLLCDRYGFSPRILETVRSKMRRLGIIDHVSRFSKSHGYRWSVGWFPDCVLFIGSHVFEKSDGVIMSYKLLVLSVVEV